jgi:hypothetical protein
MNGQSFLTYLETILVPSLSAGDKNDLIAS